MRPLFHRTLIFTRHILCFHFRLDIKEGFPLKANMYCTSGKKDTNLQYVSESHLWKKSKLHTKLIPQTSTYLSGPWNLEIVKIRLVQFGLRSKQLRIDWNVMINILTFSIPIVYHFQQFQQEGFEVDFKTLFT